MTIPEERLGHLLHAQADRYQPSADGMEKIRGKVDARRRARLFRRIAAGAVAAAVAAIVVPLLAFNRQPVTGRVQTLAPVSPGTTSPTTPATTAPPTTTGPPPTAPSTTTAPPATAPATRPPATAPSTTAVPPTTVPPSTTTTSPGAAVLPPAKGPPVAGVVECNIAVTTADGNATPLGCPESGINVAAWNFYAPVAPHLLSLGRNATMTQVTAAACSDLAGTHATDPEATSAAQLAGTYYGWPPSYSQDLSSELAQGVCNAG